MHQRLSRAAALLVLVLGFPSSSGRVLAQTPDSDQPADVIPFTAIARRRPNGLKYFVRGTIQRQAHSLRLAVKAGSLDEADVNGGRPFIEHMAFNGSAQTGRSVPSFESVGAARSHARHKLRRNRLHARPPTDL
jgi:hypothetical protein